LAGSTTAIIRSCDSDIRISSGAQRHPVEPDVHAAVAGRRELGGRAGQPGAAEVLDADDELLGEDLERALDQELLLERVAHLDAGPLGGSGRLERLAGEHADAADPVTAGARAVQDHLVAGPGGLGEVQLLVPHHADAERVDQRVAGVRRVEDRLTADVRQAEAVAVAADARHDPGQHAVRVGGVERAEPQRVHHGDRSRTHGEDVADDAPDAGRGALVGLDVGRVVVRLDLERDGVPVTDVDHAGVLADADHQVLAHLVGDLLAELPQVHLGRLVGAVLAPHHGVHRQLRGRRPAAEDLADVGVLVGLEPQVRPRLLVVGSRRGRLDRVEVRTLLGQRGRLHRFGSGGRALNLPGSRWSAARGPASGRPSAGRPAAGESPPPRRRSECT
jgi:hypothetical protein